MTLVKVASHCPTSLLPPDPDKKSYFNHFYPKPKEDVTIQTDPQCQRGRVFSIPELRV